MNKIELERMLLDPEGLKQLAERAASIKQRYGDAGEMPSAKCSPVEEIPSEIKQIPGDQNKGIVNLSQRNPILSNIGLFIPELSREDPKKALAILTDRCNKEPSEANQLLLEDAINRLTTVSEMEDEGGKLVTKAIETLSVEKKSRTKKDQTTDSIWSTFYEHRDYHGRSFFLNLGPGAQYRVMRMSWISSVNLNDRISSLYVAGSASESSGETILFEKDRYFGRYSRFSVTPGGSTATSWTPYVGDFINDKTSSVMIVRHYANELPPITLGKFGIKDKIKTFTASIPQISLRRDPVITWDMWPDGGNAHPNDPRMFIQFKIPVRVDVPNWFDYDAEIWYWLYPYISQGHVKAYVAYYGAWVEGGVKSGRILDRIMSALPPTIPTINNELASLLEMTALFGSFEKLYLLPGDYSGTGNTEDDVTIVLCRT